jgi:DNA-binding CsgD family transcriptional regulator
MLRELSQELQRIEQMSILQALQSEVEWTEHHGQPGSHMQHLLPLYLVLCILPGIAALTVLSVLASRVKNIGLTYYLVAYACFTISGLKDLVMFYLGINISEEITSGVFALITLSLPIPVVMHTMLPLAVNATTRPPGRRWIDIAIVAIASAEMVLYYTPLFLRYSSATQTLLFGPIFPYLGIVEMLLIGYSIVMITARRKAIANLPVRRCVLTTTMIVAIFLPAIAYDQFRFRGVESISAVPVGIILAPSFYAVLSLATLYFGIRFLMSSASQANPDGAQPPSVEPPSLDTIIRSLAETSALSEREMTIIPLIAGGLGNKQIALELNISSKTVGNHIYNIYRKLNIASRYELLALLK